MKRTVNEAPWIHHCEQQQGALFPFATLDNWRRSEIFNEYLPKASNQRACLQYWFMLFIYTAPADWLTYATRYTGNCDDVYNVPNSRATKTSQCSVPPFTQKKHWLIFESVQTRLFMFLCQIRTLDASLLIMQYYLTSQMKQLLAILNLNLVLKESQSNLPNGTFSTKPEVYFRFVTNQKQRNTRISKHMGGQSDCSLSIQGHLDRRKISYFQKM